MLGIVSSEYYWSWEVHVSSGKNKRHNQKKGGWKNHHFFRPFVGWCFSQNPPLKKKGWTFIHSKPYVFLGRSIYDSQISRFRDPKGGSDLSTSGGKFRSFCDRSFFFDVQKLATFSLGGFFFWAITSLFFGEPKRDGRVFTFLIQRFSFFVMPM